MNVEFESQIYQETTSTPTDPSYQEGLRVVVDTTKPSVQNDGANDLDSTTDEIRDAAHHTIFVQGDRRKRPAAVPLNFVTLGLSMGMDMKAIRRSAEERGIAVVQPKEKASAA